MSARRRAFTLVELLVSVALATMIVGILAQVSIQAQRAIAVTTLRDDAARDATAALDDIERDLQQLLPAVAAPPPFSPAGGAVERTLQLEAVDARPADPRDRLRVLTTVRAPDGSGALARGVVEWTLGARTADPGNGPDAGDLTRRIVSWARAGDATTTPGPDAAVVGRAISLAIEWQQPDGRYAAPDGATSSGAAFVREGTVEITDTAEGTLATATGASAAALDRIPVGDALALARPVGPPLRLLLRRRPGPGRALLGDRVDPAPDIAFGMFQGPPAVRVTIVVPFGRGPEAGTATFSRTISVPR